eukprot:gene19907-26610_t
MKAWTFGPLLSVAGVDAKEQLMETIITTLLSQAYTNTNARTGMDLRTFDFLLRKVLDAKEQLMETIITTLLSQANANTNARTGMDLRTFDFPSQVLDAKEQLMETIITTLLSQAYTNTNARTGMDLCTFDFPSQVSAAREQVFCEMEIIITTLLSHSKSTIAKFRPLVKYQANDRALWVHLPKPGDAFKNKHRVQNLKNPSDRKGDPTILWTTDELETALTRYRNAVDAATKAAKEQLDKLCKDLRPIKDQVTELKGLWPYWRSGSAPETVKNDLVIDRMLLLTGPNMAGKSTLLRSVAAVSLLANCGLMVPAQSATVPAIDALMLRNFSGDSPLEGKSSFAMEMVIAGTALTTAMLEKLCLSVRRRATWKVSPHGHSCFETLALEVAHDMGVEEHVLSRASEVLQLLTEQRGTPLSSVDSGNTTLSDSSSWRPFYKEPTLLSSVDSMNTNLSPARLFNMEPPPFLAEPTLSSVDSTTPTFSSAQHHGYGNGWFYGGETDDIKSRLKAHRAKKHGPSKGLEMVYVLVGLDEGAKSGAKAVEAATIQSLDGQGFPMLSVKDGRNRSFATRASKSTLSTYTEASEAAESGASCDGKEKKKRAPAKPRVAKKKKADGADDGADSCDSKEKKKRAPAKPRVTKS